MESNNWFVAQCHDGRRSPAMGRKSDGRYNMNRIFFAIIALFCIASPVFGQVRTVMVDTNKFVVGPVGYWLAQPLDPTFSNAVNAVALGGVGDRKSTRLNSSH